MRVVPSGDTPIDIHSDEHRRALDARRGHANGSHIAGDSDNEQMASSPDPYALATFLADMKARTNDPPTPSPPPPKVWTLPVIVSMIGVALAICVAGASLYNYASTQAATTLQGYTQLGDRLQSFGERMLALDSRVGVIERDLRDRGHTRDQEVASLTAANSLQDERLRNLTIAIEQERQARTEAEADARRTDADQRAVINDLTKAVGDLRTDLKVLVDRAQRKGELDMPEKDAEARASPR